MQADGQGWQERVTTMFSEATMANPMEAMRMQSTRSNQCEAELIAATTEEAMCKQEMRKRRLEEMTTRLATLPADAMAVEALEGGFQKFAENMNTVLDRLGVERPQVTIEYKNLTVGTNALMGSAGLSTVGNTLPHTIGDLVGKGVATTHMEVLRDLTGVIKPGRYTLLLGPPGSGKSTYLRALTGRLKKMKRLEVSGEVLYNGHPVDSFVVERVSSYVQQHDIHIPILTVGETLDFASAFSTGSKRPDYVAEAVAAKAKEDGPASQAARDLLGAASQLPTGAKEGASGGGVSGAQVAPEAGCRCLMRDADGKPVLVMDDSGFVHAGNDEDEDSLMNLQAMMAPGADNPGLKVELILRLMGMTHTRNTLVGNALTRGVSGGERKRVTSAEMLVGHSRIMAMDEISTGLDSATLFSIITFLKQATNIMGSTVVIGLLQPPPEVMMLFEDIILMAEGTIVYHGPVTEIQDFFLNLGFDLPDRMDLPSWLQEITTPAGQWKFASAALRQSWAAANPAAAAAAADGTEFTEPLPDTETGKLPYALPVDAMRRQFWEESAAGKAMMEEVTQKPYNPTDCPAHVLYKEHYAVSGLPAFMLALKRQFLIYKRNKALVVFRTVQSIIIGILIGSIFLQLQPAASDIRLMFGAMFLTIMYTSFGSTPEAFLVLSTRPIWYKYRDNFWLSPSNETLAMAVVRFGNTIYDTVIFGTIVYFMVGLTVSASAYFTYFLLLICVSLDMSALFRLLGAVSPTPVMAQSFGALGILVLVLTSGFAITRTAIPPWFIWAYYISPFSWGLRGILINEMTQERWMVPAYPGGPPLGVAGLESFGFFTGQYWIWAGVGAMLAFYFVCNGLTYIGFKWYSGTQEKATMVDERAVARARAEAEARRAKQAEQEMSTVATTSSNGKEHSSVTVQASQSTLPFTPVTLVFKDLKYFVPNPSFSSAKGGKAEGKAAGAAAAPEDVPKELMLLKGITGYAEPGVLMALMGGSGAGKTTLMDVIAGRKTVGRIEGDIFVNGKPKDQDTWARTVGYVEQMDIHTPATTVAEALWFSARLRLPKSVGDDQVRRQVDDVIDIVDMLELGEALVGEPGQSGLSTEQRKRLTIAVELVANPAVVFADEPTSGLDARAASIVMKAIKNVALSNRTVFVTIHQPSIQIFEAFDFLMLLQRGGRVTYFGPLGTNSSNLVSYLESVPGTTPIKAGYNPATWMLEVTGGSMATTATANNVDWPQLYKDGQLCANTAAYANQLVETQQAAAAKAVDSQAATTKKPSRYAQPFKTQLVECTRKLSSAYWRMPQYNFTRLCLSVSCGLIYGLMYLGVGTIQSYPASISDVQNVLGVLFSTTSFMGNINLMTVMPVFSTERVVFYRERASLMYDPLATGLSVLISELPYLGTQSVIFTIIVFFMVGFVLTAEKFFFFMLMTMASLSLYTMFGIALVAATPTIEAAQIMSTSLNFLFNILNGFVVSYNDIPVYWQWLNRLIPTTWVIYGMSASQLGDNNGAMVAYGGQNTTVSAYLQDNFGYYYDFRWWCLLIVMGYVAFFAFMGVMFLKYVSFLKR